MSPHLHSLLYYNISVSTDPSPRLPCSPCFRLPSLGLCWGLDCFILKLLSRWFTALWESLFSHFPPIYYVITRVMSHKHGFSGWHWRPNIFSCSSLLSSCSSKPQPAFQGLAQESRGVCLAPSSSPVIPAKRKVTWNFLIPTSLPISFPWSFFFFFYTFFKKIKILHNL